MKSIKTKPKRERLLTPEQFAKLPLWKRKVLIAEDVIKQIELKKINVEQGTYVQVDKGKAKASDSARDCILDNKLSCTVCARGAMFISSVKFKNVLTVKQLKTMSFGYSGRSKNATRFLSNEFTPIEQATIETAFESDNFVEDVPGIAQEEAERLATKAQDWHEKKSLKYKNLKNHIVEHDDYILINICKNIIRNSGNFIP